MASYPRIHMRHMGASLSSKRRTQVEHADSEIKYHEYHGPVVGGVEVRVSTDYLLGGSGVDARTVRYTDRRQDTRNFAGPPISRQEAWVEQHMAHEVHGAGAIQSTEIRRSNGRDFDGEKNGGATDALAEEMRSRIEAQYSKLHHK